MYARCQKFFRGHYLIAEYDKNDVLLHIYDNLQDLAKAKKIAYKSAFSYLLYNLNYRNHQGCLYLVDVLGFVNDEFYQADIDTIDAFIEEIGNE